LFYFGLKFISILVRYAENVTEFEGSQTVGQDG